MRLAAADALLERLLHDLKQPLNLISVTAQDVQVDAEKGRLDVNEVGPSMRAIREAVDQLVTHVDQLRGFARPMAGSVGPEGSDVNEACRAAVARFRGASLGVEIHETLAPSLPPVRATSLALEQALWELLDNAVWAAADAARAPTRVEISTSGHGDGVLVSVQDNGKGVAEGACKSLFEPFFTTRSDAAGLGLALVSALVNRAGGRICLARSSSEGSRFEIEFPAST